MKSHQTLSFQIVVLLIAVTLALVAGLGQTVTHFHPNPMLKPGDEIDGMRLTTGAAKAPPLSAFCSPALEIDGVVSADCQAPSLSRLAIGHMFGEAGQALQALDWSALTWELYLDGQAIAVQAFGIYEFAIPDLAPWPSSIREIFRQGRAWDVVLINPTPGEHTLHGLAHAGADTYTWAVNFTILTDSRLKSACVTCTHQ